MIASENNATASFLCVTNRNSIVNFVVTFFALPFHILMLKILVKDIRLPNSRHKFMLFLSVADALNISTVFLINVVIKALNVTAYSFSCHILGCINLFAAVSTLVLSSLATVALSVERKIVCMHFPISHRLLSQKRTHFVLCSFLSVGLLLAVIATALDGTQHTDIKIAEMFSFQIISASVIMPTAVVITAIHFRLFFFSRARIGVIPSASDSRHTTATRIRKKQLKIAFFASIVAIVYTLCMVPMALIFLLEGIPVLDNHESVKISIINLAMVNSFANPFVYCIGLAQTRKLFIANVKQIFNAMKSSVNLFMPGGKSM